MDLKSQQSFLSYANLLKEYGPIISITSIALRWICLFKLLNIIMVEISFQMKDWNI